MDSPFYWRHARDSLLTPAALRMFQLLAQHDGKRFDNVKAQIDEDYRKATGTTADARHGGIIQTQLQVFREAGWVSIDKTTDPGGGDHNYSGGEASACTLDEGAGLPKGSTIFRH